MLWACLHFFDLPLHAAFAADEHALPCALTAGPRQRPHVFIANRAASRLGVRLAQPLAAARACVAQLLARARDEAAEKRLLHSLAAWAYRFSSHVSLDGDAALLVEVGASLRLFGGWPALDRRLRDDLQAIGHAPRIAVAPVAGAARVLAHKDGIFAATNAAMLTALGNVQIADSGLDANAIALLGSVGLRTLHEVFALPQPELARRLGLPVLEVLDRMRGHAAAPLLLYRPPEMFDHRVEFEARISSWPPLLFPLRRLCEELSLFLAARDGGVQRCVLVLEHEDRAPTRIPIELLTPQREARTLYDLIRSRLERATLAAPACALALVARDLPSLRPRHADLFETRRTQALAWPDLAERLRSKLGDESVRRLVPAADHRPEFAWRFEADLPSPPADTARSPRAPTKPRKRPRAAKAASASTTHSAATAPAPIAAPPTASANTNPTATAFGPAPETASRTANSIAPTIAATSQPVSAPASTPHAEPVSAFGPPRAVKNPADCSGTHATRLRPLWLLRRAQPLDGITEILAGPERIESGWWDGGDVRRDYYVVRLASGQRAWAFHATGVDDSWMLHGWFA